MSDQAIYVTRPHLPPLEDFLPYLEQIWDSRILTNKGPFHEQFEQALCAFLGVDHLALCTNGTVALIVALQALRITGEVITTPFSFVATAHALLWNKIKPVFVDIDPLTLNLDPDRIEAAITPKTSAILPVHCYGNPCAVDRIEEIATQYNLKVIYDAAHAFGVRCHCGSVLSHGDLSILSFHATKVFTTFEGGAIVCPDAKIKQHIDHLKNFGFVNETTVVATGINGKMNEFSAALGLLQLNQVDQILEKRARIDRIYRAGLDGVEGVSCVPSSGQSRQNYAYFAIRIGENFPMDRDVLYERLKQHNVFARRYFFPLIADFPMYRGLESAQPSNLPNAHQAAAQVLCLPIYPDLSDSEVHRIISIIRNQKTCNS